MINNFTQSNNNNTNKTLEVAATAAPKEKYVVAKATTKTTFKQCSICLDVVSAEDEAAYDVTVCPLSNEHPASTGLHRQCLASYVQNAMNNMVPGTCPPLYCPQSHVSRRRPILTHTKWKSFCTNVDQYEKMAEKVLSITCSSCHNVSSLLKTKPASIKDARKQLTKKIKSAVLGSPGGLQRIEDELTKYSQGFLTVEELYAFLKSAEAFPALASGSNDESRSIVKHCMAFVDNVNQRANLQLRYLKDRPICMTTCCDALHCFNCKSSGLHEGRTCEENMLFIQRKLRGEGGGGEEANAKILHCPSCRIALIRSDGCNTIKCVCGNAFDWDRELRRVEAIERFLVAIHPRNAREACFDIFRGTINRYWYENEFANQMRENPAWHEEYEKAIMWYEYNEKEMDRLLLQYWRDMFPHCPHQACLLYSPDLTTTSSRRAVCDKEIQCVGFYFARKVWRRQHEKEVWKCKGERDSAMKSIFSTFCPTTEDKTSLLSMREEGQYSVFFDNEEEDEEEDAAGAYMEKSMNLWLKVDQNHALFDDYKKRKPNENALQFLHLHGGHCNMPQAASPLRFKPSGGERLSSPKKTSRCFAHIQNWEENSEQRCIRFDNEDLTFGRIESRGRYPAVVFNMHAGMVSSLTLQLVYFPFRFGIFTFGIVPRDKFPFLGSNGVGCEPQTCGIRLDCDDVSYLNYANAMKKKKKIEIFGKAKLKNGDFVTGIMNPFRQEFSILLNNKFLCSFKHLNMNQEYQFAVTVPNYSILKLVPSPPFAIDHYFFHNDTSRRFDDFVRVVSDCITFDGLKDRSHLNLFQSDSPSSDLFLKLRDSIPNLPVIPSSLDADRWYEYCVGLFASLYGDANHPRVVDERQPVPSQDRLMKFLDRCADAMLPVAKNILDANKPTVVYVSVFVAIQLTWEKIYCFACWYFFHERCNIGRMVQRLSDSFEKTHGGNAPFICAFYFSPNNLMRSTQKDDYMEMKCYMGLHQDALQEWYDDNEKAKDPIVTPHLLAPLCRCIPRHTREHGCPCPVIKESYVAIAKKIIDSQKKGSKKETRSEATRSEATRSEATRSEATRSEATQRLATQRLTDQSVVTNAVPLKKKVVKKINVSANSSEQNEVAAMEITTLVKEKWVDKVRNLAASSAAASGGDFLTGNPPEINVWKFSTQGK